MLLHLPYYDSRRGLFGLGLSRNYPRDMYQNHVLVGSPRMFSLLPIAKSCCFTLWAPGTECLYIHVFHLAYRFLLELRIAYRKHFIHHQYLRLQKRCHSKSQPHRHSRAVTLHRRVDIPFTTAEIDDLVQLALYLRAGHAQDSAVHEDILPSRHLAMETRPQLPAANRCDHVHV